MVLTPTLAVGALAGAALTALVVVVAVVLVVVVVAKLWSWLSEPEGTVEVGPITEYRTLTDEEIESRLPKPAPPVLAPEPEPPAQPDPEKKPGNTSPIPHIGQEDENEDKCKEQRKNYPVHQYKDAAIYAKKPKQSHHVVQNAHFWEKGAPLKKICKNYDKKEAPCIALGGPSTDPSTDHGIVTDMQNADARAARASGKPMTFGDAMKNSEDQLRAGHVPEADIACIMVQVLAYFQATCPGISSGTVVRTPYEDFED